MRRAVLVLLALAALPACGSAAAPAAVDAPAPVRVTAAAETTAETAPAPAAPAPAVPAAAPAAPAPPPATPPVAAPAPGPERPTDPGAALRGRTFTSTAVQQDGRPRPLLEGTALTVAFEDTTVRWQAGCNAMGAVVRYTPDVLDVIEPIGGTAAGCDADREAQDAWTADLFGGDPRWALAGTRLTLTRGGTAVELEQTG